MKPRPRSTTVRGTLCPSVALGVLLTSSVALAQESGAAVAEVLFRDGRALMAAGDLGAACPKFAESNRIDPKLGTLMNLALCHEKSGRTATAWAEYTQAVGLARRAGQTDREKVALARVAELEPTLPRVAIDADPKSGAVVALDDQPVGPAAYGTPIPVDPGAHVLRASADGMKPFERSFRVEKGAPVTTLKVPALEPASSTAPEPQTALEAPPASSAAPASSTTRAAGFVVGGVGVVLAGLGAYFGAAAFSEKNTAANNCYPTSCTPTGTSATNAMRTDETLSTIGVAVGLGALGAGLTLILWNPGGSSRAASAGGARLAVGLRGVEGQLSW